MKEKYIEFYEYKGTKNKNINKKIIEASDEEDDNVII